MTSAPQEAAAATTDLQVMEDWAVTSFSPWDPRITNDNIWPIYRAMRDRGRVVRSDAHGGFYCLTHYRDVRQAASDFRTFVSSPGVIIGRTKDVPSVPLEFDRPEHTRYRKPMQAPFLRHRVGQFRDLVERHVDKLLDAVDARGPEFDIVRDIAAPLPLEVISEFLGIREERFPEHQRLAEALVRADVASAEQADQAYYSFMGEEVRAKMSAPGDDFISELWSLQGEGERFDETEIVRMARGIALPGHHSTINGTASMLMRMADPEPRAAYLEDRSLGPGIVDEALRIDPPIHYEGRTTTAPVTVAGTDIPVGSKVALLYACGNRDPEAYPDPDRFDPTRAKPLHLSFGHGIHKCLGEHLSRMEMQVVLERVFDRFPDYRLMAEPVGGGIVYGHHMAWDSMPAATR